jgi:hypothetical protein
MGKMPTFQHSKSKESEFHCREEIPYKGETKKGGIVMCLLCALLSSAQNRIFNFNLKRYHGTRMKASTRARSDEDLFRAAAAAED